MDLMRAKALFIAHRRVILKGLVAVAVLIAIWAAVSRDYALYQATIARVTGVSEEFVKSERGPNGEAERYYRQSLALEVMNGARRGEVARAENSYAESLVKGERYGVGDDVFVALSEDGGALSAVVTGEKRDVYVALLAGMFAVGMVFIAGRQGAFAVLSFCANVAAFVYAMRLYVGGGDFLGINLALAAGFCVVTLLLSGGVRRRTLGAILSTVATLAMTFALYRAVTALFGKPPYDLMDYVFMPEDLSRLFLAGVLIGCLGAIMDVAITVNSAIAELALAAPGSSRGKMVRSVRAIGHDIMGTMINVLLFSYVSGSLPIIVIKIVNGYSIGALVRYNIVFELVRFLVGSIGIVLAIPVSGAVAILLVKRGDASCCSRS